MLSIERHSLLSLFTWSRLSCEIFFDIFRYFSTQNATKSQLVDLMTKHEVDYVDLPATDIRVEVHEDGNWDDTQNRGELFRVALPKQTRGFQISRN